MSRYLGGSCRLCRLEKIKLFLKGKKCYTKCVLDGGKRKNLPGQHTRQKRRKQSDYNRHLREKQKAKRMSGLTEEQFRNIFAQAEKMKGITGENLIILLETRLDSVIQRLGFSTSKKLARQFISHGHILVNGRAFKVPGYRVKVGDKIKVKEKLKENALVTESLERTTEVPSWLALDKANFQGEVVSLPNRQEISYPLDESLIVELYSK